MQKPMGNTHSNCFQLVKLVQRTGASKTLILKLRDAHVKSVRSLTSPVFRAFWIPECQVNNCLSVYSSCIINTDTIWSKRLLILC